MRKTIRVHGTCRPARDGIPTALSACSLMTRSSQRPAQEAPWAQDQDDRHQREQREQRKAWKNQNAEAQPRAVDHRAEEGAPERAKPANHHDDKGLDDDL